MSSTFHYGKFEWDTKKDKYNHETHGIAFKEALHAFLDENRIIAVDELHSQTEDRLFCIGQVEHKIATVRFTMRGDKIRIIGAGFWRKGKKLYEEKNGKG